MPLVLESSSCCDICAEDYNCEDPALSPHAIDCGHIFCRTCIRGFAPSLCPICRQSFSIGRKLHVDDGHPAADTQSGLLLERTALAFDETSTSSERGAVIDEVNVWLSTQSNSLGDLNAHRPLRAAFDALCRQQSRLNTTDDLETLRAVEESLRMQLQEDRRTMSELNDKLQIDLNTAQDNLQAERDRLLAEIWIEKEASAAMQQELRDGLRDATSNVNMLRSENARLLSLVQEFKPNVNTSSGQDIEHDHLLYGEICPPTLGISPIRAVHSLPAARSAVELTGNASSPLASTQRLGSRSSPRINLASKSVDNIRDRKAHKTRPDLSAEAIAAYPYPSHHSKAPQIPPKYHERKYSSVGIDITLGFQESHEALGDQSSHLLPMHQFLLHDPQSLHHDKSPANPAQTVSKPRRILKMASSPLLRKNQDRTRQTGKGGPGTDTPPRRQAGQPLRLQKPRAPNDLLLIAPWESNSSTSTATTQASQANSSDVKAMKKPIRHWWPHGWKL